MGVPFELLTEGSGLASTNAVLVAVGTDVTFCDLLVKNLIADFGASFNNPEAVRAGVP